MKVRLMRKIGRASDLIGIELDINVISVITEQLNILDKNYRV